MKRSKIIPSIIMVFIIFFIIIISYKVGFYWSQQSTTNRTSINLGIKPEDYLLLGETNYTKAFARAIIHLGNSGGTIILSPGKIYTGDIIINKPNITISGGGKLKGSIVCDYFTTLKNLYCNIDNIEFLPSQKEYSIKLERAIYPKITNCKFDEGIDKAILIDEQNVYNAKQNFGQMARIIIITNNVFNSNYSLYRRAIKNDKFLDLADVTFTNNQCVNKICNVYLDGVDGFICNGNTFFLPGYNQKNTLKTYNIYINRANWTIINSNNCFEAGLESIKVIAVQNINIVSNNIASCGQRVPSSGISISGGNVDGNGKNISSIANNIINHPSGNGIDVIGGDYVKVNDNLIYVAGNADTYYGSIRLDSLPHYGIYVPEGMNVYLINNITPDNDNNLNCAYYDNIENGNKRVTK